MKKFLSILLTILMIISAVPMAFAAGDGVPLTLNADNLNERGYIEIGSEQDYYDEDGYIITLDGNNGGVDIYESSDITLNSTSFNVILCDNAQDSSVINFKLVGANVVNAFAFRNQNIIFNGGDEDTLSTVDFHNSLNDSSVTVNGGNITLLSEGTYNFCVGGGLIINGGTVTGTGNYINVTSTPIALNGGELNLINTSADKCVIDSSEITMKKGTLLTVSAESGKILSTDSNIVMADGLADSNCLFVRYDTTSDFVPVSDIKAALDGKTYAEIKIDSHTHSFTDGKCECGISDGVRTTLDVSKGNIVIADSYVTLGSETVEVDPDGYIITGTAWGNTPLKFINDSGTSITFDLVFDNLSLTATAWCSVMAIEDYSPVTLNIVSEGSNTVSSYNHPCFNNTIARTSITINITKTEGSSIYFERKDNPENGILFDQYDSNTVVYINGYQLDESAVCYDGVHKNLDGIQTCKGYKCDVCGQYFGEKDETNHYSNGIQTCKGYKCEICDVWYGEANGEHIDENLDNLCDICDTFIGVEIKVGDTYTVKNLVYIKFVPSVSGTYILSSSSDYEYFYQDPFVALYDSTMNEIAHAENNNYYDGMLMPDYDFTLVHEYSAGETYYFRFSDHRGGYNYPVIFECKEHQGGTQTCKGYACDACGEWYGEADADNHDIVVDEAVAPTCTETGLTEGSHCTRCDNATVAQEVIPANGHTPLEAVKENEVAPECEKAGTYDLVVYCDVCDEELDRDTVAVDALGHTESDVYSATSDCHYKNCTRCDYVFENTREAHQFTEEIIKEPTETESGLKRVICTICGVGYEKEIPAEGTTDPTPDEPADNTCDHICHSNNAFVQFIWKIISFLQRIFNVQQYCDCGELHYDAPIFG